LTKIIPSAATSSECDSDSDSWVPYSNRKEKYVNGLKNGISRSRKNVTVGLTPDRGRTGFATKDFQPGDFVCEYVGSICQVDSKKGDWGDVSNQQLNMGSYCLDVTFNGISYVIDATNEPAVILTMPEETQIWSCYNQ